jgi:NAD(P)H-nitrite reductase large subunit
VRAPHKLKSAVSGCVRECAEAQGKDFGLIATERGWNVYVCGNGGATPRHADLLVSDVDEETAIRQARDVPPLRQRPRRRRHHRLLARAGPGAA